MVKVKKGIALIIILFIMFLGVSNSVNAASNLISMSKVTVSNILDQKYTGAYIKPNVVVRYNGTTLTKDKDYTVSYSNNRNAGRAKATITGKGNYIGSKTVYFNIVKNNNYNDYNRISISKATVSNILNQKYTGRYIEPTLTIRYNGYKLREGRDYTVSYSNNRNVGTARITITGKGNYTGTKTVSFKIVGNTYTPKINISKAKLERVYEHTYTGYYIEPDVTLTYDGERLREGTDYTLSYSNNKNVGYGKITIVGKGRFAGTWIVGFKINGRALPISDATVSKILNQTYTGYYIRPNVTVRYDGEKLEEGTDYTLSYSNNKKVGTAKVTITGRGNYKGTKTVTFKIVNNNNYDYDDNYYSKISMSNVTSYQILNQMYTGRDIKPSITLRYNGNKLVQGRDYTVSYSNNKNVGTARVTITGKGNYKGTKTITFKIVKR